MTKQKIPDHIVNGTHSQVIDFKELAESAGNIYHVHSKPAGRMTVAQLEAVELRLKEIAVKLGIDSI